MITRTMCKFAEQVLIDAPADDPIITMLEGAGGGAAAGVAIGSLYNPTWKKLVQYGSKGMALGTLGALGYGVANKILSPRQVVLER